MKDLGFREVLGNFATGVTVITTSTDSGPAGITVNSFNSVSMDPPLVLWSLSKSAKCLTAFTESQHFAIHIMAYDQIEIAKKFARSGIDKFSGIALGSGVSNLPLLSGCSARLQCKTAYKYEGGDHLIFVGEVLEYDISNRPALVFYKGVFGNGCDIPVIAESGSESTNRNDTPQISASGFIRDSFPYLLARAHFQLNGPFKVESARVGMDEDCYLILLLLSVVDGRTIENLTSCLEHTNHVPTKEKLAQMHEQGFIEIQYSEGGDYVYITATGMAQTKALLNLSVIMEERLRKHLGEDDTKLLKRMLNKVINTTDPGVPDLWDQYGQSRKSSPNLRIVT